MSRDTPMRSHTDYAPASRVQVSATLVGAVFLMVGVLGFIPGFTTSYDAGDAAGHESNAELLGLFQVSVLHNVVHLLFGVAGTVLARTASSARAFLMVGGAVYLVLWFFGLVVDRTSQASFVPLDSVGDWVHFFLGVGMVALGVLLWRPAQADHLPLRG